MTLEEKKEQLYNKMEEELEQYKEWLCGRSPEEILEYAYSYATKEDILVAFDLMEMGEERVDALAKSPCPLGDIYDKYCNIDGAYMDVICDAININADKKVAREREGGDGR